MTADALEGGASRGAALTRLLLLWLFGAALRITLLAVPPLIPLIHAELGLNETAIGVLSALPVLLFAVAAVPGSLLIARLGVRNAVLTGLVIVALFSATRGALGSVPVLFASTFLMGVGIAFLQPAMPVLVKDWFPRQIGIATAIYSNGLLVGQTMGAGLTLPLVLPLAHGSWRLGLVLWGIPVLLIALLFAAAVPARTGAVRATGWLPDWRDRQAWQLGLVLGSGSSLYFAANAFLPDYLRAIGQGASIAPALTALSLFQIPAPLLILSFSRRLVGRRAPFLAIAGVALAALAAIVSSGGIAVVLSAGILGFCTAFVLTLCLALPPLLVAPGDVHRISAGMFAVGYACAVIVPVVGGALWDVTGTPVAAFAPGFAAILVLAAVAARLDFRSQR